MDPRYSAMVSAFVAAILAAGTPVPAACPPLNLPERRSEDPPAKYLEFCARHPVACDLSGPASVHADAALWTLVTAINHAVNASVRVWTDMECYGVEERWEYPTDGVGDCEDIALEKRRRLVAAGVPSAALTMTIVHHEVGLFAHAVLLLETDSGTWVLDSLTSEILCWDVPPFDYERRERPDGLWTRYERTPVAQP